MLIFPPSKRQLRRHVTNSQASSKYNKSKQRYREANHDLYRLVQSADSRRIVPERIHRRRRRLGVAEEAERRVEMVMTWNTWRLVLLTSGGMIIVFFSVVVD